MPKIVRDNGFVIRWGPYTKKELDGIWAEGVNGAPISSPSLSLSTKLIRSEKRKNPRRKGDTGLAGSADSG
jgi:hypothetical protein